jgi:hypothetical protein
MIVEYRRYKKDRENDARRNAPAQLEPHGIKRDVLTYAFSLHIPAEKIIREDRQHRAEHQLKHASAPFAWRGELWSPAAVIPNIRTEIVRIAAVTTMRTSVSPGPVMNDGKREAMGLSGAGITLPPPRTPVLESPSAN